MNNPFTMKRLLICLLVLSALSAGAQPVYDCQRAAGNIRIDGRVTDSEWAGAEACPEFRDIRGEGYAAPKYLTTMRMLWDDENLYVSAVLEEPDVRAKVARRDDIVYHDNDFEVFLNPYGDEKLYYELEINALGTVMDLLMEKPYSQGGTYMMTWDFPGLETAVRVDGTLNRSGDTDRGWSVEIKIPFAALSRGGEDPLKCKVWRANFSRVEWLTRPEENWVWAPTGVVDIHHPLRWGYLRFIEADGTAPDLLEYKKSFTRKTLSR